MSSDNKRIYNFGSDFKFKKSESVFVQGLRFLLEAAGVALVLVLVVYVVFALTINTDVEGRLKRENKMYEKLYPQLVPQQKLIDDAVEVLQIKDNNIYSNVFHSEAPSVDPINSLSFLNGNDTIPDTKIIAYTAAKADNMMGKVDEIEAAFRSALLDVADPAVVTPPMLLPVKGISFSQVGASKGDKLNPFYRAYIAHEGLDFIVGQGDPVYATADGKVTKVDRSNRGMGNMITISHDGGYVTRYAHLSTINVKEGQTVKKGSKIGGAGMSGFAFAPHLHYEVMKGGVHLDPINYIFGSVGAEEYTNMLYTAVSTQQSMD